MKKIGKILCICCFLGFLGISMAVTVFSEKETYSYFENRNYAELPACEREALLSGEYMKGVSAYLQDHSAWREGALRADTWLNLHLFKCPVVNQVVVQEDILLPYLPHATLREEQVAENAELTAENILAAKEVTEQNGGEYYCVTIPCQYAYFSERYPEYMNNRERLTALSREGLKAELAERGIHYLDMGEVFSAMGNPPELSSSMDNHFSLKGAYLTYRAVAEQISETSRWQLALPQDIRLRELENPYMGSRKRKLFGMFEAEEKLLWAELGKEIPFERWDNGVPVPAEVYRMPQTAEEPVLYEFYMGGDIGETVIKTHRPELPKVLIYGDSFTNALESLMYYSFDEMRSLDFRHYTEKSLGDYIADYQPDIVLFVRDYEAMLSFDGNGKSVDAG